MAKPAWIVNVGASTIAARLPKNPQSATLRGKAMTA
jgi:hypothetical protein